MADAATGAFDAFVEAYHAGERPDARAFAARAGDGAADALALIDAFLARGPRPARRSPDALARLLASPALAPERLGPAPASFPEVLVALRSAVEPRRAAFAARLADALGLAARADKVKRLYADLESGVLPPTGISTRLQVVLAGLLGVDVGRLDAPARLLPPPPPAAAFARSALPDATFAQAAPPAAAAAAPEPLDAWDEVDELFRGGP